VTGERRMIAVLSAACALLLAIAVWAIATRGTGAPSNERATFWVARGGSDTASGAGIVMWGGTSKPAPLSRTITVQAPSSTLMLTS